MEKFHIIFCIPKTNSESINNSLNDRCFRRNSYIVLMTNEQYYTILSYNELAPM